MSYMIRKRPNIRIRKRTFTLFLFFAILLFALVAKLFCIQLLNGRRYREMALTQRMQLIPVYAERGTIYDRNLTELAVSIRTDGVYVSPPNITKPDETARSLANILHLPYESVYSMVKKESPFVWVSLKVTPDDAKMIREMKYPGVKVTETVQRFYPKRELAAHILGVAGMDNQGLEGLEYFYEKELAGQAGYVREEQAPKVGHIPQGIREIQAAEDGNDIVLTIDEGIQYIAERELGKAIKDTGASKGTIIVMNPGTGELLAIANYPTFDPNGFAKYSSAARRNIAITDMYEPGSTFKLIIAAAALEEGLVSPNEIFFDPGYIKIDGKQINCEKKEGHGWITFAEAIVESCNVALSEVGLRFSKERFYDYIRAFNFGKKTGIDFPGEASGLLIPEKTLKPIEMANIAFGQGISVTPLQILLAVSCIANDGVYMQPYLVKEIRSKNGQVLEKFEPTPLNQVISKETSDILKEMMERVVTEGTGKNAAILGYRVAGKTGTSQKPEGGTYGSKRIASFVGFAPVDEPKLAIIVVLDEPKTISKYGGVLAAPVFKTVLEDSLRYLGIPPYFKDDKSSLSKEEIVAVPDVIGRSPVEAKEAVASFKLRSKVQGQGSLVVDQHPRAGNLVSANSYVVIYLKEQDITEMVVVPNVLGLTMKRAAQVLAEFGLKLNPSGSGMAVEINPKVGIKVEYGSIVDVLFR